jgi:hypothetical protein
MQDNVVDEVSSAVRARMASPVFGSFVVAYVAKNWQFFYILAAGAEDPGVAITRAMTKLSPYWHWIVPLVVALIYAGFGGWLAYPFHELSRRAEIFRANRLAQLTEQHLKLDFAALKQHPSYGAELYRTSQMGDLLILAWNRAAESFKAHPALRRIKTSAKLTIVELPALFIETPPGNATQAGNVQNFNAEAALCAFVALGENEIVCAEDCGLVRVSWEMDWRRLDFRNGRFVPVVDDSEPDGPHIERATHGFGIYRSARGKSRAT